MVLGFGKKDRDPDGAGCYGKLLRHGDYVSHMVDGKDASSFASWLNAGYRLTGGKDDPEAAGTRFLFPGRGKRVFYGTLWPSGDASGTRRFPFTIFSATPAKRLTPLEARIPLALAPVWKEMANAMTEIREAERVDAIQARLASIRIPEFPEAKDLRARFERLAASATVVPGAFDVLFDVLRLTSALAPGRRGDVPAFAIRLDLRGGSEPEVEVSMWLALLARGIGENALPGQSHVFFRPEREGHPGELFVYHRELKPEDLGYILAPVPDYPYVNSLGTHGDLPEASTFREWCAEKLGPNPTIEQLLEADYSAAM